MEKTLANMTNEELYELGYEVMDRVRIRKLQQKYKYWNSEQLRKREEQITKKINELHDESEIITEMFAQKLRFEKSLGK